MAKANGGTRGNMRQPDDAALAHHGRAGPMARLSLLNLLYNILTLSLWRFWGKTRVRRALWGDTTLWGDPFEYTGTGGELFKGFLVAMIAVLAPLMIALQFIEDMLAADDPRGVPLLLVWQALGFFLLMAGLYRVRRYQLGRTLWRGIRAGQTGSAIRYGLMVCGTVLAAILSLGWALPWGQARLERYRMGNTTFGDRSFASAMDSRGLYGAFAMAWFAGLLAIGGAAGLAWMMVEAGRPALAWAGLILLPPAALPYAHYRARFYRRLAETTRFDGLAFAAPGIRAGNLARLALGNLVIVTLSLGVLRPLAAQRLFRFACAHLRFDGSVEWASIHQNQAARPRMGEGLAAALDGAGEF